MTTEMNTENMLDLVFQGAKEAIDLEVQQLRDEGWPVFVWKDNCVQDISADLHLAENGRLWFLFATTFLFTLPIVCVMMFAMPDQWIPGFFLKSIVMFTGVGCFGMYALGAWYGAKRTRRLCLLFMTMLFPLLTYLIISWYVTGFFVNM
jgi:hypothetical protein